MNLQVFPEEKQDIIASRGLGANEDNRTSKNSLNLDAVSNKASTAIQKVRSPSQKAFVDMLFHKKKRAQQVRKPNLLITQQAVTDLSNKLHKPSGTQASFLRIKTLRKNLYKPDYLKEIDNVDNNINTNESQYKPSNETLTLNDSSRRLLF